MQLIPHKRQWWRLYSVWAIILLGMLGSMSDLVTTVWDYLDWPMWTKVFVYAVGILAGIASRLITQEKVTRHEP